MPTDEDDIMTAYANGKASVSAEIAKCPYSKPELIKAWNNGREDALERKQ